MNEMKS